MDAARLVVSLAGLAGGKAFAEEPVPEARRTEIGALPLLGYDTDVGLSTGAIVNLAHFAPGAAPYAWRLQAVFAAAFKAGATGVNVPLHDDSLSLDVPGLRDGALRVLGQVYIRRFSNARWFGTGGDSSADIPAGLAGASQERRSSYHEYERFYPGASVNFRTRLWERVDPSRQRLELLSGGELTYSDVTTKTGSLLDEQLAIEHAGLAPDASTLRQVLRGVEPHVMPKLRLGLLYDTRDNEFEPARGIFLEGSARFAPAPADLRHAGILASASGFVPLGTERIVLAGRLLGDALIGNPPFFALSEAGGASPLYAPGGSASVRGVLLQRFAGKIKLVANAEVRVMMVRFAAWSQRFRLGSVAFGDAGRAIAGWQPTTLGGRNVDGAWTRITAGAGGGLRLVWGETFTIRTDLAFSPTEGTQGFYVGIGEVF